MKEKHSQNFLIGLIIGTLIGVAIWYWQKSTTAEDGALDLLDRLAVAERKMNQMRSDFGHKVQRVQGSVEVDTAVADAIVINPAEPDDLTKVKGIGPTYATRLQAANIQTYNQLKQMSVETLATTLNINETWASNILEEAQNF